MAVPARRASMTAFRPSMTPSASGAGNFRSSIGASFPAGGGPARKFCRYGFSIAQNSPTIKWEFARGLQNRKNRRAFYGTCILHRPEHQRGLRLHGQRHGSGEPGGHVPAAGGHGRGQPVEVGELWVGAAELNAKKTFRTCIHNRWIQVLIWTAASSIF